jgi:uncharacterized damage-inducible protein DinB
MTIAELLLCDFDAEVANTRRVLERIPDDKLTWKPHDKSMAIGNMAFHVATLPGFGLSILGEENLDLATKMSTFPKYAGEGSQALLGTYDHLAATLRERLSSLDDNFLQANWIMTFGAHTVADAPRYIIYRTMYFNHLIHHRGQLNVYLRLLDIAVPGIYGPSADEPFGA